MIGPKILFWDIETSPIVGFVWGLFDQNVGLNQIKTDWHLLSFAAKWGHSNQVIYADQRGKRDMTNDKDLLLKLWNLLDEADIVVTQNGKRFDSKKVNARFVMHGIKPPSPYKHIDTLELAKRHFGFTSNKLAYMSDKLCTKYKKLTHHKFEGFELWKECLKGNKAAWNEMKKYNCHDVLSLEELYGKLAPWDSSVDRSRYGQEGGCRVCGSFDLQKRGHDLTATGKFQRYQCKGCGAWCKDGINLLCKTERASIKRKA